MATSVVDPKFAAVAKMLYGDLLDPREAWELSKANDPADLSTPGAPGQKKKKGGGEKIGGALLLGTVAEGSAAYQAGKEATAAVRGTGEAANVARKVRAIKVGHGVLQTANLGVGLVAARQLLKKPKPAPTVTKAQISKGLRTRKIVISPADAAKLQRGASRGTLIAAASTTAGVAALAHHRGYKRARKLAAEEAGYAVQKAFNVKVLNPANVRRVVSLKARKLTEPPPMATQKYKLTSRGMGGRVVKAAPTQPDVTFTGEISKVDTEKRHVFGWCSLSLKDGREVVDLQGDYVPLDEIEKSAYHYVLHSRKGGDMHKRVAKFAGDQPLHTSDLIESFVVTPDKLRGMGLTEDALPHGWWVGFKVNDEDQWQMVKNGERAGFSIHGTGQRKAREAA